MQQQLPERAARVRIEVPVASLNLSTFVSLYTYGYTNVHELGPLLDVNTTKIEFERRVEKKAGN